MQAAFSVQAIEILIKNLDFETRYIGEVFASNTVQDQYLLCSCSHQGAVVRAMCTATHDFCVGVYRELSSIEQPLHSSSIVLPF